MSTAEPLATSASSRQAWQQICDQHPDEWVCLQAIDAAPDGSIRSASVVAHSRSMRQLLASINATPDLVVAHTRGRPLHFPRIEMTDEIRDLVRARR